VNAQDKCGSPQDENDDYHQSKSRFHLLFCSLADVVAVLELTALELLLAVAAAPSSGHRLETFDRSLPAAIRTESPLDSIGERNPTSTVGRDSAVQTGVLSEICTWIYPQRLAVRPGLLSSILLKTAVGGERLGALMLKEGFEFIFNIRNIRCYIRPRTNQATELRHPMHSGRADLSPRGESDF